MKRITFAIALIIAVAGLGPTSSSQGQTIRNFTNVEEHDPEMDAAIAEARRTLREFWTVYANPKRGDKHFALKVKISEEHRWEHFWVVDVKRKNGKIYGTINNEPEIVRNVKFGQRIEIPQKDISDWMYVRGGKIHGNRTLPPQFKYMSPEEVAVMKRMLANPGPR